MSSSKKKVIPVLLEHVGSQADVVQQVPILLEGASLWGGRQLAGLRVLVKPNLLCAHPLACTPPETVAAACGWLLDHGARVSVADSPGFGSAGEIARKIGLTAVLRPMGLTVRSLSRGKRICLPGTGAVILSTMVLNSDLLLSVARFKVHSQMLLTLSCKNCYGCIPGVWKAFYHMREGRFSDKFADMQSRLMRALPPVAGVVDGRIAMHETGPSLGFPYPLRLLGVCSSPVALDESLCQVVGLSPEAVPLQAAFIRAGHGDSVSNGAKHIFPRDSPKSFSVTGFRLPSSLQHTSFSPDRLLFSCIKRFWMQIFH